MGSATSTPTFQAKEANITNSGGVGVIIIEEYYS